MDDQAIGGGSGEQMGKSSAETADNSGPLDKRILSKNWSVRAGAYDELTKMSADAPDGCKAEFMKQHIGQWKVYLKDNNPGALEKALNCFNIFMGKIHKSVLTAEDVNPILSMLIEKCLTHMKPVLKKLAGESVLLLFEAFETFDESQDTLTALAGHKVPKNAAAGTVALALLLENFGVKKLRFQDYAATIVKNATSTNPAIKTAAYEFYKACYKWMGDAILPLIEDKLKKQQIDDLKKLFEEVKAKGDKSKRVFKSEKAAAAEAAKDAAIDAAMAEESKGGEEEEVLDPLEFAPEVDIIGKYNAEWMETTAAIKKWNDKVAAVEALIDEVGKVKVKSGNPEGLAAFCKKEIGNSNINVAIVGIKAGAALGKAMKKDFAAGIKLMINAVLLKYKEKRGVVLLAVEAFMDAALLCTDMDFVKEEFIPCITNIAPGTKAGTIKWVEKAAKVTYIDVLKNVTPELGPAIAKAVEDKDGTVREAALQCAGILKGRLGAAMDPHLKGLNPQKMTKVDEAAKEVKPTKYDRPENWKPPPPKPDPKAKPAKKAPAAAKKGDDDDEMMDDVIAPKRGPPKGIGVKPKKKVADDVEMADEEEAAPAKKPARAPPNIGKKPEPRKPAAAPTKGPTAPVIQEEDLGAGLSKEAAIDKAQEYFSAGVLAKFDAAKWQEKKEAFDELCAELTEKQPPPDMIEASAKFVKAKMKDWKESNINLQKGIVALYQCYATLDHVGKRTVQTVMSFFVDKLGDVKLVNLIKPVLMDLAELVTPKFISNQIIKYAATAKAPKILQESCVVLTNICDEFGSSGVPLKETIDYGKLAAAHTTPTVRQAANALFVELYKHVGDGIRSFMTDIKESTLKLIDAELDKTTQYKKGEHEKKRSVRGAAAEAEAAAAPAGGKKGKAAAEDDPFADLPKEDISKKLNAKLMEQFKHKDWKIRKKGGDDVEAIIREAKMRIENNGLNDLMDVMKNGMKDPNKAVVKVFIILLGLLAEAIGPSVKQYTKKCYVPMLQNVMDKQALVRNEVINATNKWAEVIGAEIIINKMVDQLIVENPESRTEIFRWITEHKDDIPNANVQDMVKPLVTCLTDKSKQIREDCQKVIMVVMPITGHQDFYDKLKDMKAAVQQTLKPMLDKIKAEAGGPGAKEEAKEPEAVAEKKPVGGSFGKAAEERKREKSPSTQKGLVRKQAAAPAPSSRKAAPEEDEVTITPLNKEKRKISDGRNKYPLNEVKGDHVERLQGFCEQIFGQKFHDLMFAKAQDFNKHIKCVEVLNKLVDSQPDQVIEVLDIILKWCNVRINDSSNTKLLMSVLDFFANLIQVFIETAYILEDFEAVLLIGTLCDRAGVNNKILLEKIRKLIRMSYEVYDVKLVYRILLDAGVKSKNMKAVAENLDEVADYFAKNGIDSCTKKDFALFLTCADMPDKGVRENSLKVFGEAYTLLGEDVWRMFPKDIPIKVKGLLEARFKQVAKKAGGAGLNKTGGNLNLSMNSAKATTIKGITSSDIKTKRMSMAPSMGVGSAPALGGLGLRFNKKAAKEPEDAAVEPQEETESSKVTKQMQAFELEERKEEVHDKLDTNLQNVFQGKGLPQDNEGNVEMENQEDDVAIEAPKGKGRTANMSNPNPSHLADVSPADIPANAEMHNEDEMNRLLDMAEDNLDHDPEFTKARNFILNHIKQLKIGDLLKRVDSLVALNEMISANGQQQEQELTKEQLNQQKALVKCCNQLIDAFTHVMDDIFKYPVQDIPLRFTKYFITIVNKTCASKEIMKEVSQTQVNQLAEQLLTRLLIENLDKIGQNKEGELILKNLNSSMLRMLENCNHTYIFVVLFTLLKDKKDDMSMPKLAGLIIKCLLKLSKIMDKLIDKLDLSKFLIAIHEYLCCIDHDNKSQNDDLGIRIVKTLVNEVVKLRREAIWQSYAVIENHPQGDMHIKRWITIIIKSLPGAQQPIPGSKPNENQPSVMQEVAQQPAQSRMYIEFEIKKIVQDLKDPSRMEQGIEKLNKFTKQNPTYDYQKHLLKESEQFAQTVNSNLNAHRMGKSWQSTTGGSDGQDPQSQNPQSAQISKMDQLKNKLNAVNQKKQDLNSSLNEQKQTLFESKMAKFQGRKSNIMASATNNLISSREGATRMGTVIQGPGGANNLNSSFSALNNSLSQKWAQINSGPKKIGGLTGRPGALQSSSALAQTVNPGFGAQGANALNTSNNKFQRKATGGAGAGSIGGGIGGFAERVQKQQSTTALPQPPSGLIGQGKPSPSKIGMGQGPANRSLGGANGAAGGISSNSFRARIQGFGNAGAQGGAATTVPQNTGGASATNSDLQKRLADMKAKLQGLKKA